MKDETREYIVPIRMTFTEKDKIKKRAEKTNKSFSAFMRDSALGCEIKEKPDKIFYDVTTKQMGKFMRTLRQLESLLYHEKFIDERILKQEIEEWQKFRTAIREKYL